MRSKFKFIFYSIHKFSKYPLHFFFGFLYIKLFGSIKNKIRYDVFRIPHYAFGIYEAALRAKELNFSKITVIEFGVANGRGLLAMVKYADKIAAALNIEIQVIGFDSGEGMPKHEGYKDHPELYVQGDFPMQDPTNLRKLLPDTARLIIANLNSDDWTKYVAEDAPIGFISVDVDYYSSTINLFKHLHTIEVNKILPNALFYLDDVYLDNHNPYQGELLAMNEFNQASTVRKFDPYYIKLKQKQKFYNEPWLSQIYQFHSFDHPIRSKPYRKEDENARMLGNKYLKL
jgi:hypothetical protein